MSDPGKPKLASPCREVYNGQSGCNGDRVGFIAPFIMDPALILATCSRVRTACMRRRPAELARTAGHPVSGDLTRFSWDYLSVLATAPRGPARTIFAGSQGGEVSRSTDGGASWTDVTGNLPDYGINAANNPVVTGITFNPGNPSEAWVTDGLTSVGHVWHTTNAGDANGTTWTDIIGAGATGVPDAPAYGVLVDPNDPQTVYVGTYYGARVCRTCGGTNATPNWERLGNGLPNTPVAWLSMTDDNQGLVAWTKGRGAWVLTGARPQDVGLPVVSGTAQQRKVVGASTGVWLSLADRLRVSMAAVQLGRRELR